MRTMYWWILAVVLATGALAALAISPFNVQQALDSQLQVAAENPTDPRVFNDLGNLWIMAGELGSAEEAYRRALELNADQPSAHFNLALLLQQTGRYEEALAEYKEVLRLEPMDAWSYYQIGTLYDHWKDAPRAIQHYARAFSLDPELAFPEVNPHVIENRFKTQALLRAHREVPAAPLAPRAYEEPVRIGALLIPPVPGDSEDETGADVETRMAGAAEEMDSETGARRLTTGDLDPNAPSNQAAPVAGGRGGSSYRPAPGNVNSRASRYQQLRQMQRRSANPATRGSTGASPSTPPPQQRRGPDGRPVTVVVPQGNAGGSADPEDNVGGGTGGRNLVPSSGPNRPGTASTGRLDIELIPRSPGAPAAITLAASSAFRGVVEAGWAGP